MTASGIAKSIGPPLLFGIAFLGVWELIVAVFDIAPFTLPAPSAIWSAFIERFDQVLEETLVTGKNALIGFLLGSISAQYEDRFAFGAGAVLASFTFFFALGYGARLLQPVFAKPFSWRLLDGIIALTMWLSAASLLLG